MKPSRRCGRLRAGLNLEIRFHDLRHSHAGQMLKQGAAIKVVSERLGHSTPAITLTTFSHVLPGMREEAVKNFDRALRKLWNRGTYQFRRLARDWQNPSRLDSTRSEMSLSY